MPLDPPHASPDPFRLAVDLSPTGMVLTDAEGRIVLVNRELERLFGYTRDELIGRTIELLVPERHRSIHPRHRARYAQAPEARHMGVGRDLAGRRKDGSEFPLEIGLVPVERDGHRFVVGSVVDISERRRLETTLAQTQKIEAIGTLAGGIAHDFNNVLSAILGYAAAAREAVADRPQVADDLAQVIRAAERGRDLVQGILAFSRSREPRRETTQLATAIEEARRMLRATLPSTVEIRTAVAANTPPVLADPTQLHQVLVNLATNGARALGERGGLLEVEASAAHVDTTLTRMHPQLRPGLHAHLVVRDHGRGMSPAVLARAFEPFFTTRSGGEGTGLGLAVVQGIVHDHGGAIGIQSAEGAGTTVHVYLPESGIAPVAVSAAEGEAPRGHGERILYVDDEVDLSRLWKRLLQEMGYVVDCHLTGTAALEALRERPDGFDLLITDYTMPGMTGLALAEEAHRLRPDLAVIMMSGYREGLPPEALERARVNAVLGKPFSTLEIGTVLRAALDAR